MASYADMSLEEIIRDKKNVNVKRNKNLRKTTNGSTTARKSGKTLPLTDARNKIISKKRTQITDARDKLAEMAKLKDARLKLEQLRNKKNLHGYPQFSNVLPSRGKFKQNVLKGRVFIDHTRQVVAQSLKQNKSKREPKHLVNSDVFLEKRCVQSRPLNKSLQLKPIVRTVENDFEMIDDPRDEEMLLPRKSTFNRKASMQLKIVTHNNLTEHRSSPSHRASTSFVKETSPPRPPSILKKRPMAALRSDAKTDKIEKPNFEYRIIVSNLRSSVTGGDIQELFGDVGGMLESRLVRPGTAEVIYKTQEDAQKAVDLYHNRQLDGQPMNCLLVTPRATAENSRSSNKTALYSTNSNVEPDLSTFHKVLFSGF